MPTQGVPWQMPQGEGRSDLPVVMRPLQWHPAAVAGPAAALRLSPSAPRRGPLVTSMPARRAASPCVWIDLQACPPDGDGLGSKWLGGLGGREDVCGRPVEGGREGTRSTLVLFHGNEQVGAAWTSCRQCCGAQKLAAWHACPRANVSTGECGPCLCRVELTTDVVT